MTLPKSLQLCAGIQRDECLIATWYHARLLKHVGSKASKIGRHQEGIRASGSALAQNWPLLATMAELPENKVRLSDRDSRPSLRPTAALTSQFICFLLLSHGRSLCQLFLSSWQAQVVLTFAHDSTTFTALGRPTTLLHLGQVGVVGTIISTG